MTSEPQKDLADRLAALEAKLAVKPKKAFPTATVLAILPIGFGLYQFHLSNEFKQEDNQTRALLAALEGESPSDICGNLSLLVQGKLVTEERLEATQSLIDEITQRDRQQVDGGVGNFDCLPRIATPSTSVSAGGVTDEQNVVIDWDGPVTACSYREIVIEVTPDHNATLIETISTYLESQGAAFAERMREASEWEVSNYAGMIWYYSVDARQCAKELSEGLEEVGISLTPRYYTRADLPSGLPIRIWPKLSTP